MTVRVALAFAFAVCLVGALWLLSSARPRGDLPIDFAEGLPHAGQWRNGFAVADMNGDGALDLVFSPARKGAPTPTIFLGDGHGAFRHWREARFEPLPYDYGAATVADFNGDGVLDLALGVHLRGLAVLVHDGRGNFRAWNEGLALSAGGAPFSSRAVAAYDVDGDGRAELVALSDGPRPAGGATQTGLRVYSRIGEAPWVRREHDKADAAFGDQLALADVDGDGRVDALLGSNILGARSVLRRGSAEGFVEVPLDLRARSIFRAVTPLRLAGRPAFALSFSTSQSGAWTTGVDLFVRAPQRKRGPTEPGPDKADVAAGALPGRGTVGDGAGGFVRLELFADAALNEVFALAAGDADGDGDADIAAARNDGTTTLLLGDGHGHFERKNIAVPPALAGCRSYALRFADIDADGGDELIAAFAGERDGRAASGAACDSGGGIHLWKWPGAPRT